MSTFRWRGCWLAVLASWAAASCSSDELRRKLAGPVVLDMQVEGEARASGGNSGGRTPGQRHTVVLFGFLPGGLADVGDPSAGRESWPVSRLAASWRGLGLRLVEGEQR